MLKVYEWTPRFIFSLELGFLQSKLLLIPTLGGRKIADIDGTVILN